MTDPCGRYWIRRRPTVNVNSSRRWRCQILAVVLAALVYIFSASAEDINNEQAQAGLSCNELFARVQRVKPKLTLPDTYQNKQQHYRARRSAAEEPSSEQNGGRHAPHPHQVTVELPLLVTHRHPDHSGGQIQEVVTNHVLDLHLNKDLIPQGYFFRTQTPDLQPLIHRPEPEHLQAHHCHYHGTVRGRPSSWAALSTCDGVLRGVVFDGHELHYLEPTSPRNTFLTQDDGLELLHYRDSDRIKNLTCDRDHAHDEELGAHAHFPFKLSPEPEEAQHHRTKRSASGSSVIVPWNSNAKSRYVELVLVVDNRKFIEAGRSLREVEQRTKEIANIVNVLYAPLNIFIALVGVVVWNEADEITLSPKGDETLASFLRYRRERLLKDHPNDNAQLLTAFEFEEGVVGKAMQGPICSYKYSGGVNSDYKSVLGVVATTVAHELGHNFGLSHDTDTCTCEGPNSKCIMSASSSSNRTAHWSSCSKDAIAYAFKHGMDYCLRNEPKSLWKGPVCGNGFTEPGEQCDCGHAEHCNNPCCNPQTCTLYANATCGAGQCCDYRTCHPKAGGTVCRAPISSCDLPEYCNGETEHCPVDVQVQDGADCKTSNGAAYCFRGQCRTHTDQCKLLWGPTGQMSTDMCYQKNVNGSRYGHCGYNLATEQYARCAREDALCGALQCRHEEEKLQFGYEQVAILSTFFLNAGGTIHPCRSVTTDFGLQDVDPGLAPDGARCGDGRMCVSQKCVPVESVLASVPRCPDNCNGNGVCNSKGHCHCDEGFGGDSCDFGGYGGSVDSGPALNPYSSHGIFAKALYVTFLGFIPLIAVISFYLYYAGDNLKRLCLRGQLISTVRAQIRQHRAKMATAMQNGRGPPGGSGSGGAVANGGSHVQQTGPPNSTSNNSMTAADDFFGQYKGFSLSPARAGADAGVPNGGVHPGNQYQNLAGAAASSAAAAAAAPTSVTLLKNENRSPRTAARAPPASILQKGTQARVSWAHPIAHTTAISPEGNGGVATAEEESDAANSDTPLYENSAAYIINTGASAHGKGPAPRSPAAQSKARPLSSPDALQDTKMFAHAHAPNSVGPDSRTSSSNFFGGSTSALQRLASVFPFVRNSFMKSSSSVSASTESNHTHASPSNRAGAGITRQKSFNRDSVQISQPILEGAQSAQIEAKMAHQHLVPVGGGGDVVDGPGSSKESHRYKNVSPGPRYTNVPLNSPSPSPPAPQKPPSPKFIGKSVVAKPFSRSLVRLKSQSPERSPSPPSTSNSTSKTSPKPNLKTGSPPPVPRPNPKPTVTRAQSMNQPNRNSFGGGGNYNSLRRSRPSVPPPKPPSENPPPPPAAIKPKDASPPARPKYQSCIGGRFTSRNEPTLLSLNTAAAKARAASASAGSGSSNLFAPLAKIDDMNSPSASSIGSASDIKPCSNSNTGGPTTPAENIYDVIDEGDGGGAGGTSNSILEEKIETLSTGSSENGGLLSEIISEISSRNRDSIYNSMDRRKLRKEKQKSKPPPTSTPSTVPKIESSTPVPASAPATKPKRDSSPKPIPKPAPPASTAITSATTNASLVPTSISTSTRITVNPGFDRDRIIKPAGPISSLSNQLAPAYTPKPVMPTSTVNTASAPPASVSSAASNYNTPPHVPPHAPNSSCNAATVAAAAAVKPTCAVNGIPKVNGVVPCSVTGTASPTANSTSNSSSYMARINYFTGAGAGLHPITTSTSKLQDQQPVHLKPINSLSQSLSHSPAPCSILGGAVSPPESNDKETIYAPGQLSTIRRSRQYKPYLNGVGSVEGGAKVDPGDGASPNKNSSSSTGVYARPVATPQVPTIPKTNINSGTIDRRSGGGMSNSNCNTLPLPNNYTSNILEIGASSGKDELELDKGKGALSLSGVGIGGGSATIGGYKSFHPYLNRPLTFSTFGRSSSGGSSKSASAGVGLGLGLGLTPNAVASPGAGVTN